MFDGIAPLLILKFQGFRDFPFIYTYKKALFQDSGKYTVSFDSLFCQRIAASFNCVRLAPEVKNGKTAKCSNKASISSC